MPGRVVRSNGTATATKSTARKRNKKRPFDAYAAASKTVAPERRLARHRLGEEVEEEPRQKRRRDDDEDEDEEDEPKKKRTSKQASVNDDNDVQYGSDSSGNEWTMGGLAEDDEDSDLDSDEAFGESDDGRFEGFTFRGSSSNAKSKVKKSKPQPRPGKGHDVDLNEDGRLSEDSDDSQDDVGAGLGDDAVDLATMLDDTGDETPGANKTMRRKSEQLSDSDEDSESGDSGDGDADTESQSGAEEEEDDDDDDDQADEIRNARIRDMLDTLDSQLEDSQVAEDGKAAVATMDDFLEDTIYANDKTMTSTASKKKSTKSAPLTAPLPKRQQDRLDREEASKRAKQQLDRWRDTVVRNRRAEFLTFPLQDPTDQSGTTGKDKFNLLTQQKPRTDLEESIMRIMEESGLTNKTRQQTDGAIGDEEAALLKGEDLATNKMPVEEVLRRRAELRRARELLFQEEIKAKRIAKIKSKSYRRVHRRERERAAEHERQAREDLGEDVPDEDEKERNDRLRAAARMSTKHRDSKWAKSLKATNRTAWDETARDGVIEQARRTEELKKRMTGADDLDEEYHSNEDSDDHDDTALLNNLEMSKDASQSQDKKGLAGLKFMQAADERKRKANAEDIERLRKEMAIADGDEEDSEVIDESVGRAIFGPRSKSVPKPRTEKQALEFEAPDASSNDESDDGDASATSVQKTTSQTQRSSSKGSKTMSKDFAQVASTLGVRREPAENAWSSNEPKKKSEWLKEEPKSRTKKSSSNDEVLLELAKDDKPIRVVPKSSKSTRDPTAKAVSGATSGNTNGWTTVTQDNASNSEVEEDESSNPIQLDRSLVQRAFAGENVQATFEAEKRELAASEDEKEISNHVPGWGAWGGAGLSKREKKINTARKHNPLYKTKIAGVKQADRKDAKLDNVIISEKQDRKGRKYLATALPHEFENQEQYERSRRLPMGPEWTTKEVHQRMTRPRVVVRKGVVGQALERPLV